jgi:hypothetical protein
VEYAQDEQGSEEISSHVDHHGQTPDDYRKRGAKDEAGAQREVMVIKERATPREDHKRGGQPQTDIEQEKGILDRQEPIQQGYYKWNEGAKKAIPRQRIVNPVRFFTCPEKLHDEQVTCTILPIESVPLWSRA